ncbi:Tn3 family transposase post-transcriptional regulator TnpC [Cupriavidus sp. NPDC089707]|uniref:Tn3 family transposase post-transcriptional regulator TnpC n=1 Tax=Cupriavidus sp. NPDC089707 TaxID=3363963 RepID=UPI003805390D
MNDSDETVETAYGRLDRAALRQAQDTYDTAILLRMVDELDALLADARAEDGLRDMLLRLHGMAHTVINGAGMTVATGEESCRNWRSTHRPKCCDSSRCCKAGSVRSSRWSS